MVPPKTKNQKIKTDKNTREDSVDILALSLPHFKNESSSFIHEKIFFLLAFSVLQIAGQISLLHPTEQENNQTS